jgi:hypothetical protein
VVRLFLCNSHDGKPTASLIQYVVPNVQLDKLKALKPDDYLADQIRDWRSAGFQFPSYCAYSKEPTAGITMVVGMESAVALCDKSLDPIDADHSNIVKPANQHSLSYIDFKAAYADAAVPQLKTALDERQRRHDIRVALGSFLLEGQQLMRQCENVSVLPPESEATAWANQVTRYFHDNMDDSYTARFVSNSGLAPLITRIQSEPHSRLQSALWVMTTRLNAFIKEYLE